MIDFYLILTMIIELILIVIFSNYMFKFMKLYYDKRDELSRSKLDYFSMELKNQTLSEENEYLKQILQSLVNDN